MKNSRESNNKQQTTKGNHHEHSKHKQVFSLTRLAGAAGWLALGTSPASAQYLQLNLVGYQQGMGRHTDPKLNGWGMAFAPDGPFCVANTATGVATFYDRS